MNNETQKDDKEQRYFVVCRLCDRKFRAITAHHLWAAHYGKNIRHPILYYKKTFQVAYPWSYQTRVRHRHSLLKTLRVMGRRRTRAWAIEEIRRLASRGKKLNYSAVETHYTLMKTMKKKFGSWDTALRAAGLDPERIRKKREWTTTKIIDTIRRMSRDGGPMNYQAVQKSDGAFPIVTIHRFGNWDSALRAAGLDPDRIRKHRDWSRRKLVLDAIRDRKRQGKPLNASDVQQSDGGLLRAAFKQWGGWDAALRAAGLYPGRIRKHRDWSRGELVLDAIRDRHRQGKPLNSKAVERSNAGLCHAAHRWFGGWDSALRAAGLDPGHIRKHRDWSRRELVLDAIRDRKRQGKPLHSSAVHRSNHGLLNAARRWWGSWDSALRAAGLKAEHVRRHGTWSPETVVAALRRRWKRGEDMSVTALRKTHHRLYAAARAYFQSWHTAMRAAGIDPDRYRRRQTWNKRKIVESIRQRARRGLDMSSPAIRASDHALLRAAERRFGGWYRALKATGIDPDRFRRQFAWTDDRVLTTIRDVHRRCGNATSSALHTAHRGSLLQYIKRRGWTLPQARAMAGVPNPSQRGKG